MIEIGLLIAVGIVLFAGSVISRIDETVRNKEKRKSM